MNITTRVVVIFLSFFGNIPGNLHSREHGISGSMEGCNSLLREAWTVEKEHGLWRMEDRFKDS